MLNPLLITCAPGFWNARLFKDLAQLESFLEAFPEYNMLIFVVWHWKVPAHILSAYKCIGLHTGPLLEGKGKGPSPIRNLRAGGFTCATVCAFEMTPVYDDGKVLLSTPVWLGGNEEAVYGRIDTLLPLIQEYLIQDRSQIPERWSRINA